MGFSLTDLEPYGTFANRLGGKIIDVYAPGVGTKLSETVESGFKGKIAEEQQAKSAAQAQADDAAALAASIAADDAARKAVGDALVSQSDADLAVAQQALSAMDAAGAKVPPSLAPKRLAPAVKASQAAAAEATRTAGIAKNVRATQKQSAQAKAAEALVRAQAAWQIVDRVRGSSAPAVPGAASTSPAVESSPAGDVALSRAMDDRIARGVAVDKESQKSESIRTVLLGVGVAGGVGLVATILYLFLVRR